MSLFPPVDPNETPKMFNKRKESERAFMASRREEAPPGETRPQEIKRGLGNFLSDVGSMGVMQGAEAATRASPAVNFFSGLFEKDPASLTNSSPEKIMEVAEAGRKEAEETLARADEAESYANDQAIVNNVKEAFAEFPNNPGLREVTQRAVISQAGLTSIPNKESIRGFQDIIQDIQDLRENKKLRRESLLNKDPSKLTDDEKTSLALVSTIPILLGAVMGGKKGLMAGIAAALGGASQILNKNVDPSQISNLEKEETDLLMKEAELLTKKEVMDEGIREKERLMNDKSLQGMIRRDTGGKPLTEAQNKDLKYAMRAEFSNNKVNDLVKKGYDPTELTSRLMMFNPDADSATVLRALAGDPEDRQFYASMLDFTNAINRSDSGAAIPVSEVVSAMVRYGPALNDDKATIQHKADLRKVAIVLLEMGTGLSEETMKNAYGYVGERVGSERDSTPKIRSEKELNSIPLKDWTKEELDAYEEN